MLIRRTDQLERTSCSPSLNGHFLSALGSLLSFVLVGCRDASEIDKLKTAGRPPALELKAELSAKGGSAPFAAVVRSDEAVVFVDPVDRLPFQVGRDGIVRAVLRAGSGPSETSGLIGVASGPSGQVALLDGVQRRLHVLDSQDSSIVDRRIDVGAPFAIWWPDDANRVWIRGGTTGLDVRTALHRVELSTGAVTAIGVAAVRAVDAMDGQRAAMCLQCPSAISGDSQIVGFRGDTSYRLFSFAPSGEVSRTWTNLTHPVARFSQVEVDSAEKIRARILQQVSKVPGFQPSALASVAPVPKLGDPKRRIVQFGFGFDGRGHLWVQPTSTVGDSAVVHWFSNAGSAPSETRLPPGSRLYHVRGDRLLVGVSDDEAVTFRIYAIKYE